MVSEEGAWQEQGGLSSFWCVDPLDGTWHFIRGSQDFSLCVGLIWEGYPVAGALAAPAWGQIFSVVPGEGLQLNGEPLPAPTPPTRAAGRRALTSGEPSERLQDLFRLLHIGQHEKRGSVLKLAHLAEGRAHFYPRFGVTREWDTAAGQAILESVGGQVVQAANFERVSYGKKEFINSGFLAWGPGVFSESEIRRLKEAVAATLRVRS